MMKDPASHTEDIVIVTGSAGGIGSAVYRSVARAGLKPIGLDRASGQHVDLQMELSSEASIRDALAPLATGARRRVVGLVNAAGYGFEEPFLSSTDESWQRVLDANLMTTVRMCRIVIPWMLETTGTARSSTSDRRP